MRILAVLLMCLGLVACDETATSSGGATGPEARKAKSMMALVAGSPTLSPIPQSCPLSIYKTQANAGGAVADCTRNPRACIAQCEAGNRDACFDAAQVIEASSNPNDNRATYPLYMRGCALGDGNACVNAGATVKNTTWAGGPPPRAATAKCQFTTFDRMCRDGHAWGCYMTAQEYREGGHRGKSQRQYERYMRKACAISKTSGACSRQFE